MNSTDMSNNTTALKQLEKSLNSTENLFIFLNKDQPLNQLESNRCSSKQKNRSAKEILSCCKETEKETKSKIC